MTLIINEEMRSCLDEMTMNTNCIDYVILLDLKVIISLSNYFYTYIHEINIITLMIKIT